MKSGRKYFASFQNAKQKKKKGKSNKLNTDIPPTLATSTMSDSEDEEVFESLMATRARRANAGSRLKQLIELEGEANEVENTTSQFATEDDENVNLLFQDDEDDQEFIEEDSDGASLGDEDEGDADEGSTTREITRHSGDEQDEEEESEAVQEINSDEVLSDSDLSASDSNESEGEKELQRQERIRKRRKKTVIPQIKKIPEKPSVKRAKKSPLITSDSLLMSSRRASSRSSAVESKQALIDRLKQSEERKAKYVPVERKHVRELTQAERMAQAAETEKENIESLNKFKEQEIVKKERQRQSLLSKRIKLQNVLRWVSKGEHITPNEEVAEARRQFELYMKKRKRLGKKKKGGGGEEAIVIRAPFSIDYDSPYQRAIMEEKKRTQQEEVDRLEGMNCSLMEKIVEHDNEGDSVTISKTDIADFKEDMNKSELINGEDQKKVKVEMEDEKAKIDEEEESKSAEEARAEGDIKPEEETKIEKVKKEGDKARIKVTDEAQVDDRGESEPGHETPFDPEPVAKSEEREEVHHTSKDKQSDAEMQEDSGSMVDSNEKKMEVRDLDKDSEVNADRAGGDLSTKERQMQSQDELYPIKNAPEHTLNEEQSGFLDKNLTKRVKFADELSEGENGPSHTKQDLVEAIPANEMTEISSTEGTPLPENNMHAPSNDHSSQEIFEGPVQKVTRNTVYFVDFNEDKRDLKLIPSNVKQILFGEQSLWPAARRSNEVKTIIRIGKQENPYTRKDNREDDLFTPITDLNEDDPMFDELKKLPRLGVEQDIVEIAESDQEDNSAEIVIQTEAPTGLYLPNGNKKVCMVSGTEVKYFDPSTGMPYSSVEVYRTLKLIEQGQAEWLGLDATDNGPVDLYLGLKGEHARHAKGVPEGF